MTTRTLPTAPLPSGASPTPRTNRTGGRIRALVAALAAWRRKRALADQTFGASRDLAGLSCHVLRDIGVRDTGFLHAGALEYPRTSALDLEIRG